MFREYAVGAKKDDNHLFQKNGFPDTDWQAKLILILVLLSVRLKLP